MQFGFELSWLCLEEKGSLCPCSQVVQGVESLVAPLSSFGVPAVIKHLIQSQAGFAFSVCLKTEGCTDKWNLKIKHMWQFLWQRTGLCNPQRLLLWWLDTERWISSLSHLYSNNSSADKNPTQFLLLPFLVCFNIFSVISNTTEQILIIMI